MPLARIYLPLTSADLTDLAEGRPVGPAPLAAHAVTPLLGRTGLVVDEEELEHAAWLAATREASETPSRETNARSFAPSTFLGEPPQLSNTGFSHVMSPVQRCRTI